MLIITTATQRSGTKAMGLCFKCGTEIVPLGEVFNPEYNTGYSFHEFVERRGIANLIRMGSTEYLDYYFHELQLIHGNIHIDIMYNQIEAPCLAWNPYSTYYIFGYLKSRQVPVIHLRRNVIDSFVSEKYLELSGGRAHYFSKSETEQSIETKSFEISTSEYCEYKSRVSYFRACIDEAMKGYPLFVEIDYEDFEQENVIPENVIDCIINGSELSNVKIKRDRIQLFKPEIFRKSIDYKSAFPNFFATLNPAH
jgi:hypothetical protein